MTTTTFDLLITISGEGPTHLARPERPGRILCGDYRRRYSTFRQVGIVPAEAATCEACRTAAVEDRFAVVIPPSGDAETIAWPDSDDEQWALLTALVAPVSRAVDVIGSRPDGDTVWMDGEIACTPGLPVNPRAGGYLADGRPFVDLLYGTAVITGPTDADGTAGLTAERAAEVVAALSE